MRKFSGCQYGPMQVRGVLREGWERGERLIGWGTARLKPDDSSEFLMHGLMHVPGLQILGLMMLAKQARFIVLTDRRILVLPVNRGPLARADRRVALPVGSVEITGGKRNLLTELRAFRAVHRGVAYTLMIKPIKKSRSRSRLISGLLLLTA